MRGVLLSVVMPALLASAAPARAEFSIPGFELVQTAPVETSLRSDDLRDPATVWSEMFDSAKSEIVICLLYTSPSPRDRG